MGAELELLDELLYDRSAAFVFRALSKPQALPEGVERFVPAIRAEAERAVERPQAGVLGRGEAGFTRRDHGLAVVALPREALSAT